MGRVRFEEQCVLLQDPVRKFCGWPMWTVKAFGAAFAAGVLAACAWGMTRADPGVVGGAFDIVDDLKVRVECVPTQRVSNPLAATSASSMISRCKRNVMHEALTPGPSPDRP